MKLFQKNGEYSWKSISTAVAVIVMAVAQIGYLITHNFDPLPPSYWGVDAGIILVYFGKNVLNGVKLTSQ